MKNEVVRECKVHGLSKWAARDGGKRYRCRPCLVDSVQKRRRKLKEILVQYAGGSCKMCGYKKCLQALDFHHRYGKDFGISSKTKSLQRLKEEVDKCDLLCCRCHAEVHADMV